VAEETPVDIKSYAQLEAQGLTGLNYVQLFVGGRDLPLAKDTDSKDLFVIEGRRSQIDSLLDDGGSVVESVQKTLNSLMRTLDDDNIRDFQNILSNIEKITSEYRDNPLTAARLEQTLNNIDRAAKDVSVASVSVDQTSLDTRLAINDKFAPLLDSLQGTITEVDKTVVAYRQLAERSTALVDTTNGTVSDFSAGSLRQIESATVELKDLLNTLNRVAEELERNPTKPAPAPSIYRLTQSPVSAEPISGAPSLRIAVPDAETALQGADVVVSHIGNVDRSEKSTGHC